MRKYVKHFMFHKKTIYNLYTFILFYFILFYFILFYFILYILPFVRLVLRETDFRGILLCCLLLYAVPNNHHRMYVRTEFEYYQEISRHVKDV